MFNDLKVSGLICCRGGSKGIPSKNIKDFCGKPLLGWILEYAQKANVFDEIILSTDSKDIAAVGEEYGATVPGLRPGHLATDESDVFDTHNYVFKQLNINDKSHIVCILTNNPFIDNKLIKDGYNIANARHFKIIALDAIELGGDYLYFRQLFLQNGILNYHFPDDMKRSKINRQTYKPTFTTINNMRWGKPSYMSNYEQYKTEIIQNGILPIPLPKTRNFDLDCVADWQIAEAVFENIFL